MKRKRANDGRATDKSAMHALRMQAIKAVRNRQTVADAADAFGFNERKLYRWLSRYAEGGAEGASLQAEIRAASEADRAGDALDRPRHP